MVKAKVTVGSGSVRRTATHSFKTRKAAQHWFKEVKRVWHGDCKMWFVTI